jgi:hypothetical protein
MPGDPHAAIMLAERRFPVRIRVGLPPEGLGGGIPNGRIGQKNCGADGRAMTVSGRRGQRWSTMGRTSAAESAAEHGG